MKEKLLSVDNLSVSFRTESSYVRAVRGISFDLFAGETVALVGESGCGKSVTASAILRLLPTGGACTVGGEILFEGQSLLTMSSKEFQKVQSRFLGTIFQDPMNSLNPTLSIGKQIQESLLAYEKLCQAEARGRVLEMLSWVGISDPERRYHQFPHQLSGGMRQRIMIAIALIRNPKLLIADEPTTALDVTIQAQILELMKSIQARKKTTILFITHDLGIVASIADRVIVMYGGKIVEMGSVQSLFKKPFHPYTQALLRSMPRLDLDKKKELIPIMGSPPNLANPPPGCPFWPRCPQAMAICKKSFAPHFAIAEGQIASCWLKKRDEFLENKKSLSDLKLHLSSHEEVK